MRRLSTSYFQRVENSVRMRNSVNWRLRVRVQILRVARNKGNFHNEIVTLRRQRNFRVVSWRVPNAGEIQQ